MGYRIIIVDDSLLIRAGMEGYLTGSGNWDEVYVAKNGQEGIDMIVEKKPDIACFDVEMPEKDGLTALKEIKTMQREGTIDPRMPVVILSGTMSDNEPNVRKARILGAADVLAKPEGKSSTVHLNMKEIEEHLLAVLK